MVSVLLCLLHIRRNLSLSSLLNSGINLLRYGDLEYTLPYILIAILRHSPDTDRLDCRLTSMGFILIPIFSSRHSVAI